MTNATNATNISGGNVGAIPYQTAANTTSLLPQGPNGGILAMNATIPYWLPKGSNNNVLTWSSGTPTWAPPATGSDYRIKDNVKPLDETFTVDKLRPVTYINNETNKQEMGLIAHELQEVYPFLVYGEKDGVEYQRVNYIGLISLLIKEIKELKEKVKTI